MDYHSRNISRSSTLFGEFRSQVLPHPDRSTNTGERTEQECKPNWYRGTTRDRSTRLPERHRQLLRQANRSTHMAKANGSPSGRNASVSRDQNSIPGNRRRQRSKNGNVYRQKECQKSSRGR